MGRYFTNIYGCVLHRPFQHDNEFRKPGNAVIWQMVSNILGFFLVLIYSHPFASAEIKPPWSSSILDCWFAPGGFVQEKILVEIYLLFCSQTLIRTDRHSMLGAAHAPLNTQLSMKWSWSINEILLLLSVGISLQCFHTGATLTQELGFTEPKEAASARLNPNKTSPSNYCVLAFWCTWGKRNCKILPWFYCPEYLSGLQGFFQLQSLRICFLLTYKLESTDS